MLSNYATETDIKEATGVDSPDSAKKIKLTSLKSDVDKSDIHKLEKAPNDLSSLKSKVAELDIGQFETIPVDLRKLSNVVKNNAAKKEKI